MFLNSEWVEEGVVQLDQAQLINDIEDIPAGTIFPLAEIDFDLGAIKLYQFLDDESPRKFKIKTSVVCEL